MKTRIFRIVALGLLLLPGTAPAAYSLGDEPPGRQAARILERCRISGGLVVHVPCGDGRLTAALRAGDSFTVHGLSRDPADVASARRRIHSLGIYGPVSIDRLRGDRLPYIDNLVNLVVSEEPDTISMNEILRVLCPGGTACIKKNGKWTTTVKPRPEAMDEWTHYLYDATGNAVSHDDIVGPPRRMQWIGSPRYSRHHDRMSSVSAVVSAGGRTFYITDEGSRASILLPPQWTLIARDAFNGTILWKRPIGNWHTHLWPLKSGPAQLPRRLVAAGDRVYATLGLDAPLTALDAATGKTIRTYDETKGTEEVIFSDGLLFVLVDADAGRPEYADRDRIDQAFNGPFWDEVPREIKAVRADSGEVLWSVTRTVLPVTLAAGKDRLFFHDGRSVVCLDRRGGTLLWESETIPRSEIIPSFYAPILVVHGKVLLFSGGETAGTQTGSWYREGEDTMTALSVENGEVLWSAEHPPSGYRSAEDLLVADGIVWAGETLSGRAEGLFVGRDPQTGETVSEFAPDVDTYWFHHRCYRGKATDNYLIMSRTGTEFIDLETKKWIPNHWVRGACLYGVMPANGMLYTPHHPCACYLEAKLSGFCALAPAADRGSDHPAAPDDDRLVQGPAFGKISSPAGVKANAGDWPCFRHDAARTGGSETAVPTPLKQEWQTAIGGRLTQPVAAGGALFVASIDTHTLFALDAATGRRLWSYTAGGRIDSPPTVHEGSVLFGAADGCVHCLRASDGALAWRFLAAPTDRSHMAFEQLESVWPVHGSVLVLDESCSHSGEDELWCVAGRSMFLDGGLRLWRLDPATGRILSRTVLQDREPGSGDDLESYVSWLNMPTALPDILSFDGRRVFMRGQPFLLDGTRMPLEAMPYTGDPNQGAPAPTQDPEFAHLFSPTGFLDDSFWHRTYWLYGSRFVSGWCGYYRAGTVAPAGRILSLDDSRVYGFGRKPQYYRWTVPIEHHLFSADRELSATTPEDLAARDSLIRIEKSKSLDVSKKPFSVEAFVFPLGRKGVVAASGGSSHGFSLHIKEKRPHFSIRVGGDLFSVEGEKKLPEEWVHLAGVLTGEKELRLYVNGKLAASSEAAGFIENEPSEALSIGADEGSSVGDYKSPCAFKGSIDEVRIHNRALGDREIGDLAAARAPDDAAGQGIVLWYSFEKSDASDRSGCDNHGKLGEAEPDRGRVGKALLFTGKIESKKNFHVVHHWTSDMPLMARAMVRAGKTLLVAGPPDLIDEADVYDRIDDPAVMGSLIEQTAALDGKMGALLLAVSTDTGQELTRCSLASPPVFDGMIAAGGRLYIAATDGSVLCLGSRP